MLKIIFFDILISSMIILELSLGILNPFLSLKIIKDILLYYIKSKNNTEIINKLIDFPLGIYERCLKEIKLIKDKTYIKELNEIYSKIINLVIEFLFIDLLPFIYAKLNEKEKGKELQIIEDKLLKMLYFGCKVIKIDTKANNNIDETNYKINLKN